MSSVNNISLNPPQKFRKDNFDTALLYRRLRDQSFNLGLVKDLFNWSYKVKWQFIVINSIELTRITHEIFFRSDCLEK
jgi:hypothetical protein